MKLKYVKHDVLNNAWNTAGLALNIAVHYSIRHIVNTVLVGQNTVPTVISPILGEIARGQHSK